MFNTIFYSIILSKTKLILTVFEVIILEFKEVCRNLF